MTASVPQHQLHEFHGKQRDCLLVVGVYNEGDKFTRQLEALQAYRNLVDIAIADGGSNDGATAPQALTTKARMLIIHTDASRGLSVQYRAALHYAITQQYRYVIMMDGNGKDGVESIPHFIEKLNEGYDFVQGSRFLPDGEHLNTPMDRVMGIRGIFNPLMYLGSGFYYTDGINGFKGCNMKLLCDPRVQPLRPLFVRYNLQYYLNYIAPKLGFRVAEIPVRRNYPKDGKPYSKIRGFSGRVSILLQLLATITGQYNP